MQIFGDEATYGVLMRALLRCRLKEQALNVGVLLLRREKRLNSDSSLDSEATEEYLTPPETPPRPLRQLNSSTSRLMEERVIIQMEQESPRPVVKAQTTISYHTQVNICHDIALALSFLHSKEIVHRDLSSNNILLIADRRAKVTDFGVATRQNRTRLTGHPGTASPRHVMVTMARKVTGVSNTTSRSTASPLVFWPFRSSHAVFPSREGGSKTLRTIPGSRGLSQKSSVAGLRLSS